MLILDTLGYLLMTVNFLIIIRLSDVQCDIPAYNSAICGVA